MYFNLQFADLLGFGPDPYTHTHTNSGLHSDAMNTLPHGNVHGDACFFISLSDDAIPIT
jgi:hypothetical protein